jgi:ribonuclease Z
MWHHRPPNFHFTKNDVRQLLQQTACLYKNNTPLMIAVTILGNNSAIPAYNRNPTAQVLQLQEESYLIDCGEGTQMQMTRYNIRRSKINRIFISHLHGDHYFGLIGLLTSMGLLGRTQPLYLHAPVALEDIINLQLKVADTTLPYLLHFCPLPADGIIVDDTKTIVTCFPVQHRIKCWGFLFREKKNPRKVIGEQAIAHEIPASFYGRLQKGENYVTKLGVTIPNEAVTIAAPAAKSYAYCADTIYDEALVNIIREVDVLYHETTYLQDLAERAAARFHSTTIQAAAIAQKANVKKLLIGHFSSKYESLDAFLTEATAVFENTELALEGACYKI